MRRGIMALEELNNKVVAPEAEVTDFVEAPENDLAEVAESETEINNIDEGIDEAADTAETLEEIRDEMGKSVEEGGMSEPEARALEVAVEHLCVRVGFSKNRKVFPAMLGFADKKTRVEKTKIAMEEIKETAKKIYTAIINTIENLKNWFLKFIKGLFNASEKLKNRAEAIGKAAEAKKEVKQAADAKVKTGGWGEKLVVGTSFDANIADSIVKHYNEFTNLECIKKNYVDDFNKVEPTLVKGMTNAVDAVAFMKELEKIVTGKDYPLVLGGGTFHRAINDEKKAEVEIKPAEGVTVPEEVRPMEAADIIGLAKAVGEHMKKFDAVSKASDSAGKSMDALIAKAKAAMSVENSYASSIQAHINLLRKLTVGADTVLKSYDIKVSKAALDFAGASLAKLGKTAAPAEEKKA